MKTAIIGAGICGLYIGQKLAKAGHQVQIYEKKPTIGKECCSGLFSTRLFDFIPQARELVENQINRCLIHFPKKDIHLKFKQPFFIIDHSHLDRLQASFCVQSGAKIALHTQITPQKIDKIAKTNDCTIGTDGALSATRAYLGIKQIPLFLGVQGFTPNHQPSDTVETWPTKNGFLWKIPRINEIEYGIIEKPGLSVKLWNEFVAKKNLAITRTLCAAIPQGFVLPQNKHITLCGDASGLTKPWSGGGVIWGLTQADILLKNFPNFLQYRKEAQSFFRFRLFLGKCAKIGVYTAGPLFPMLVPGNFTIDSDFLLSKWPINKK